MAPHCALPPRGLVGRAARRSRGPRALYVALGTAVLLCAAGRWLSARSTFVAPRRPSEGQLRSASGATVSLHAAGAGFDDEPEKPKAPARPKNSIRLTPEQLKADHGDAWEAVDKIFKGEKAKSPEAIMRARFTALKFKDPGFLAATEKEEGSSMKKRAENWATTLGVKERTFIDNLRMGFEDIKSLAGADSFNLVSADDKTVEFKIKCKDGKTLHEKSKFVTDKKYGYVYSGESDFGTWE